MSAHYPNLTTLQPPKSQKYHPAELKIDSASTIHRNHTALLVSGRFTNGCSKLYKAGHALRGDTLIVSITAWQPANKMCTQVMRPFSFIFDKVAGQKLKKVTALRINQRHFNLHP